MIIKIKGTGVGQVGPQLLWGHGQPLPPESGVTPLASF